MKAKRVADTSLDELFWPKVRKADGDACWTWLGWKTADGYGRFNVARPRKVLATHASWYLATGEWPGALFMCHSCDNPSCVNPSHLFRGTAADNAADMAAKGRSHSPRGATNGNTKLTEAQVRDILTRISNGEKTSDIAKVFGVSATAVWSIEHGDNWQWLSGFKKYKRPPRNSRPRLAHSYGVEDPALENA